MEKRAAFSQIRNVFYVIGETDEKFLLEKEFELSLKRRVSERIQRGVIKTYKPVMDDAPYRIFNRMQDYTKWCETRLPVWLGYGKTS